jgi:hypothetical protein
LSTEPHPIKVTNTAPSETTRADEIAIKTAETGKVTAVVAMMSIFSKKDVICGALIPGMEAFSPKGKKCQFPGGKFPQTKKPFSENKKRPATKEIIVQIREI